MGTAAGAGEWWHLSVGGVFDSEGKAPEAGPWAEVPRVGVHTLLPCLALQPGATTSAMFVLQPPGGGVGEHGSSQGLAAQPPPAALVTSSLQGEITALEQPPCMAVLDLAGALQGGGPLSHWYPPRASGRRARKGAAREGGVALTLSPLHADPALDIAVVWQTSAAVSQDEEHCIPHLVSPATGPAARGTPRM